MSPQARARRIEWVEDEWRRELLSDWWADRIRLRIKLGIVDTAKPRKPQPEPERRSVLDLLLD